METIGVEPVEYDEDEMRRHLEHSLAFWKGTRLSQGMEVEGPGNEVQDLSVS